MKRVTALAAAALVLLLSACGTSEPAAQTEPGSTEPSSAGSAAGPVSVTDARDKKLDLPAPPAKVVGLEWGVVESLITLGVMPVGVADTKGYSTWVSAEKLDPSVKDVGKRGEPSVDAIVGLDPDLVVTTTDEAPNTIAQLEKAVPVLVVKASDTADPVGKLKANLELIAAATGKADKAKEVNAGFDQALTKGKETITAAGKAGEQFTMADGWKQGSSISIRMFTNGSLLGAVTTQLGLTNSWTTPGDKVYGLAQTDVEGLTKLKDGNFLYIANDADGGDVFGGDLSKNAIWKNLPFVKSDNVHRLADGIWMFGGPKSAEQYIEAAVKAVTS